MEKTNILKGLALPALGLSVLPAAAQEKQQQPNIIIIYTDDMGVGDLSVLNDGWVKTPNLDRLASEGLTMTRYYSAAPVSSPSRVGLTTGMFPLEWGINTFLNNRKANAATQQYDYLSAEAPSMARSLRGAGYRTAHFGKWHMGGGRDVDNAPSIPSYGFDEYASTWESPDADPVLTASDWIWSNDDPVKRWDRTAYFVDKTLDFLSRNNGTPCFINLWPDDMHTPWVQDESVQEDKSTWNTEFNFRLVLEEYDKQIGRLVDGIDRLGLGPNTIIIFTSDNGPAPSFMQKRTNGLRGIKNSLYEGGIRMPFIVRWPGTVPAGTFDDTTVISAVDMFPTLCAIAGADMPGGFAFRGEDMTEAFMGQPQTRSTDLMWDFGRNSHYGFPRDKYHRSPHLAIMRGKWKLLADPLGQAQLYDISTDQKETRDVAADHPEVVSQLRATLMQWWDSRPLIGDQE